MRVVTAAQYTLGLCLLSAVVTGCVSRGGMRTTTTPVDVLVTPISADITTLDPAMVSDLVTAQVLMNQFEALTTLDGANKVQPALATSWETSTNRCVYTFHLRHGVWFHSGQEMHADDVKYSLDRAVSPGTKSTTALNYLTGVVGVQDAAAGRSQGISGVKVLDPYTVTIAIDHPRAYFPELAAYPTNSIVCRSAVERTHGHVTAESSVGTGPFKFVSYTPGQKYVIEANSQYWGGRAKLRRVEFPVIVNAETAYSNFVTGRADLITNLTAPARYAQDHAMGKLDKEYRLVPAATLSYLVMNGRLEPVFARSLVRKAFARAIDRAQILKVANKGVGTVANGLLPPDLPLSGPRPPAIPYDPAGARKLLAQAGYPGGKGFPTLTLVTLKEAANFTQACEIIRANLGTNLGVNVSLQTREAGEFFAEMNGDKLPFLYTGWVADYPDPQDFLSTLCSSSSPLNHCGYNSPEFDALCKRADGESDEAVRTAAYAQANALLMRDAGLVPIMFGPVIMMSQPNVTGWKANLCTMLTFKDTVKSAR